MKILNLEESFVYFLSNIVGFEMAVRIEDILMMLCTLFLGYTIGQLSLVCTFRSNYFLSDKLKQVVFQRNEHKGIVQYDFRTPRSLLDKFDLVIALHIIKFKGRFHANRTRFYSRVAFGALIVLIALTALVLDFMLNVIKIDDIKSIKLLCSKH